MKIVQVHNYYQISGGEDTVVAAEKKLLEEKGHQVITYYRHNSEIKNQTLFLLGTTFLQTKKEKAAGTKISAYGI